MTTHTDSFTKPRTHHLLGTHLNKHLTKHQRREKAENWITTSLAHPPLPLSLLHMRHEGTFLHSSERWDYPTVDPQEQKGGGGGSLHLFGIPTVYILLRGHRVIYYP